jgi:DNA-binding protein
MQAKKYKIDAYQGVLDFTHDFHTTIDEIYIEERGIYANFADKNANVFRDDASRFDKGRKVETIEISDQVVRELGKYIEHKEEIEKIVQSLF